MSITLHEAKDRTLEPLRDLAGNSKLVTEARLALVLARGALAHWVDVRDEEPSPEALVKQGDELMDLTSGVRTAAEGVEEACQNLQDALSDVDVALIDDLFDIATEVASLMPFLREWAAPGDIVRLEILLGGLKAGKEGVRG